MWDTIHRGKSCKDMRRLDPHFKLLTTQGSAVKTLNHWSWAMASRSNLKDIDTTKFALCLVEFSQILSKGYYILVGKYMTSVSASHLPNTQQHHWMPPNWHRGLCHTSPSSFPPASAPPLSQNLPALPHILGPWPALSCLWKVASIWKALGAHRLQGRTSSPLLIQQPVQSNSNKSLPFP